MPCVKALLRALFDTFRKQTDKKLCHFCLMLLLTYKPYHHDSIPMKSCSLNLLHIKLLNASLDNLLPMLTTTCNQPLLEGVGLLPGVYQHYTPAITNQPKVSRYFSCVEKGWSWFQMSMLITDLFLFLRSFPSLLNMQAYFFAS